MMTKNTYNGWSNQQTWNIQMTYEETFRSICEDQKDQFDDVRDIAAAFESIVSELEFETLREGSLAYYAVGDYLTKVNWLEIAEHIGEEFIEAQLEEEKEEKEAREWIAAAREEVDRPTWPFNNTIIKLK